MNEPNAPTPAAGVTPHLVCTGAASAIDFYMRAFGATEQRRLLGPDGSVVNALLSINGSPVMLADEHPVRGNRSPRSLNGTPVTLHLNVPDVDSFVARAVRAGATIALPVADMFWGDRYGIVEDPFGHHWAVATPVRVMTNAEMQRATTDFMK
jgi:PhnB protein